MSDSRVQEKESLENGSVPRGLGNAAGTAAGGGTTHSGAHFAAPNVSDSQVKAGKTGATLSERKTNASTDRTTCEGTPQILGPSTRLHASTPTTRRRSGNMPMVYTNSSRAKTQFPVHKVMKCQQELKELKEKRKELADRQHRYAEQRQAASKQRADDLQVSEQDRQRDERFISEMEKEVTEKRRVNTLNKDNPNEVAEELQKLEERIDEERAALLKGIQEFQAYVDEQLENEKETVAQLKTEQDELDKCERQLKQATVDSSRNENEEAIEQIQEEMRRSAPGQGLQTGSPTETGLMNTQLQAELREMRDRQERDQEALQQVDQLLAEEENARQAEARERISFRNENVMLQAQLWNYQTVLSTLKLPANPSAQIADDPYGPGFVAEGDEYKEENEYEDEGNEGLLDKNDILYSAQDVEELQQGWHGRHQQEMCALQRNMQAQVDAQTAKVKRLENLGATVQYPTVQVTPTVQPGLSAGAPPFVPGQGPLGIGTTFYNSTPHSDDRMQQMGSVSRSADRAESANVYSSFQKAKAAARVSYGDHRIANPTTRSGLEERTNLPEKELTEEGFISVAKSLRKVQIEKFDSKSLQWV